MSRPRLARRDGQRGAAMVEFALLAPILVLLVLGSIDVSDAWFRSTSVTEATRAAGVTAFDVSDDRTHDLRVLQSVLSEMDNRRIENVTKVVLFDASSSPTVPAACLTDSAAMAEGVTDTCVVYGHNFLQKVRGGTAADAFIVGNCIGSADHRWCTETRPQPGGWKVGIYLEATEDTLVGIIPGFRNFTLHESIVVREFSR